ncbi:MAG: hypothetical protein WCI36_01145 [bacterium]
MPEIKLATPLKYNHPKGTAITVVDQYINKSTREKTWFVAPKIDGVYFGKAVNFFNNAIELRKKVFENRKPINPTDPDQGKAFINQKDVFEFFTEACSGVILLFAATESLTNNLIESASEHNYNKDKKNKIFSIGKYIIEQNKNQPLSLEQLLFLGIEEKLKNVLPQLYEFESPAGKTFWQDFKTLKQLRDGFIHCTRNHAYGADRGVNSLYAQLFDMDFEKLVNNIGDLLTYIKDNCQRTV